MTTEQLISIMQTEQKCVRRQDTPECDRDCKNCDLVLPTEDVIAAYDAVITFLQDNTGKWISDPKKDWILRCSKCNKEAFLDDFEGEYIKTAFCSNCGAKMN